METIAVIQYDESVEDQIEVALKSSGQRINVVRPNTYEEAMECFQGCQTLIINPKGQKGFMMTRIIGLALRMGIKIVQCIPDGNPETERVISK